MTSKIKNVFGLKSILIKNKLSKIEDILQKGLQNLPLVFPSQRVIKSEVEKNEALKKVNDLTKMQKVGVDVYSKLFALLFEIDRAILIYEEDRDLNLMKEEIETLCTKIADGEKVTLPSIEQFKTDVKNHVKNLRLNKKLVQDMTQRLPRYDLKNLALEASLLIKSSEDGGKDSRLSILFQKRKNALYSKYERFYDFDDLNNWLDYDRFDPTSVKYREQIDAAKKITDKVIKRNKISDAIMIQNFKASVGAKYYFIFDEAYENRAILAEVIAIDESSGIQMYKPYGMYNVKKSGDFEFKKMSRKDMKNSIFANVDFIDTKMYMMQNDKMFFIKDDYYFSLANRTIKIKDLTAESDVKEVTFYLNKLKGFGILKIDEEVDKIDTDNWKKYDVSMFQNGLNSLKDLLKKFFKKSPNQEAAKEEKVKEAPKSNKDYNEQYLKSIKPSLIAAVTGASKTTGLKMKEDQINEFVTKFLNSVLKNQNNDFKISKDSYKSLEAEAIKQLLKQSKK